MCTTKTISLGTNIVCDAKMAPNESSILSNFLLPPAPLPVVISLAEFTELFPTAQRSDPQIGILYRELQHQRAMDADGVKHNIAAEVKRGEIQRREVVRSRRREERQHVEAGGQRELQMDFAVSIYYLFESVSLTSE